jgi:hypothetical protein
MAQFVSMEFSMRLVSYESLISLLTIDFIFVDQGVEVYIQTYQLVSHLMVLHGLALLR